MVPAQQAFILDPCIKTDHNVYLKLGYVDRLKELFYLVDRPACVSCASEECLKWPDAKDRIRTCIPSWVPSCPFPSPPSSTCCSPSPASLNENTAGSGKTSS